MRYQHLLLFLFALSVMVAPTQAQVGAGLERFDVVIYGATPGGIAAAIPPARRDPKLRIALVTRYQRVGGLMTNGLNHPDFRTFEARTGLYRELNQRVEKHFRHTYGKESAQVKESLLGTHAGPELTHQILREMLEEHPGIQILTEHRLKGADIEGRNISAIHLKGPQGDRTLSAAYFVDATYEGDLMAAAGVEFHVGREASDTYGESLAPKAADGQVQGYNFRLTMTDDPKNQAPVPKPPGYDRNDYLGLLPLLREGKLNYIFADPYQNRHGGIYKRQTPPLPNNKRDINDVSRSIVRLSLPNINNGWPEGNEATRQEIFDAHLRHNVGMLYFLQHDEDVPAEFQAEARQWGFCRDELTYNAHLPEQLYIREARRMIGRHVFTQKDVERAPGTGHARAIFQPDAIAMGDYGPNCHGTYHEGPLFGGKHTGEFYQPAAPYQIPYGVLLPKTVDNLAVPVACSSSHVGFCALRLEPIWISLGQAAGEAIALAIPKQKPLPEIAPAEIRARLHETGSATIYTSDVPEDSPDFAAVQWWGSHGGLVAMDRSASEEPAEYGKRGANRIGQYFAAFPEHAVQLREPLTEDLRKAWLELANTIAPNAEGLDEAKTRGEFIRAAWAARFND